ncbi:MAG TPA: FoF1 ATP synthase subunit gamma, partial [Nitrospirales bacterium]|nr:FoF1 ATP synthase subunit gamma [Nitrospirales bacterium]
EQFTLGTFDELYVIYNEFKSAIQQRVIVEKFFPIDTIDAMASIGLAATPADATPSGGSYLFEPDEDELLAALLPKHFQVQTFRVLLESSSAEQGARMAAMDGATRNAGELIKRLTLYYNKTRQAAITRELMDIVGGAEALR